MFLKLFFILIDCSHHRIDKCKILMHKYYVNLQIFTEILALKELTGSGRFMTEMALGGEYIHFSSMNHVLKMLSFQVMMVYFCP